MKAWSRRNRQLFAWLGPARFGPDHIVEVRGVYWVTRLDGWKVKAKWTT